MAKIGIFALFVARKYEKLHWRAKALRWQTKYGTVFKRYQYDPFDHQRAVRSSGFGFNKNPYKQYIF